MALSYSNTAPASSALSGLMSGLSPSALANAKAKGIGSNLSIGSTGNVVASKSQPTKTTTSSSVTSSPALQTTPKAQSNTSTAGTASAGSYRGVNINPGSDADVMAQIKAIDAQQSAPSVNLTTPTSSMGSSSTSSSSSSSSKSKKSTEPVLPSFSGIVGDLAGIAKNGSPAVQAANEALVKFNMSNADTTKDIYSSPTSARVMQGRNAQVQLANAAKQAALASGVTNALTGQGQQITGLGTAAGYAQPTQISPGNVLTNPLTGEAIASAPALGQYGQTYYDPMNPGSAGAGASALTSGWADYLAGGGDPSQVPATVSGNAVLWQQTLQAAKQKNPGFDVNSAMGAAQARQTTAGLTSGLAGSQANTEIVQKGKQEVANMEAALTTADQNVQNLLGIMQQSGINNYNLVPLNSIANKVRANLSDSAVLQYQTLLAGTRALLTSVFISRGLAPTDAAAQADQTLAKSTTVQALFDQYNAAKSEAANLIQNKKLQIQQAEQSLNSQTQGGGSGQTTQINGRTYQKVQGGWQLVG